MQTNLKHPRRRSAFTIAEMVICFAIVGLTIGGILTAYTNSALFATRAGYQLAAQAQAIQVMERVRAALWDTQTSPQVDQTVNIPTVSYALMELPISGTNVVYATNTLSVTTITVTNNPPVQIKMIQVFTTWPWNNTVQSNVIVAYRAPDQ